MRHHVLGLCGTFQLKLIDFKVRNSYFSNCSRVLNIRETDLKAVWQLKSNMHVERVRVKYCVSFDLPIISLSVKIDYGDFIPACWQS